MQIERIDNGSNVILKLIGRIDTTTAPELEAVVESLTEVTGLVMDCGELEYVSSAGLRVILKAQKMMNTQGSLTLCNVNETIMEVFDITGFADILDIE